MNKQFRLVVYGTLRIGEHRSCVLPTSKGKMSLAKIYGYEMYALPYGFPGVFKSNDEDFIVAELWEFDLTPKEYENIVRDLDRIEGTDDGYYTRTQIDVGGKEFNIYLCNIEQEKPEAIKINDWVEDKLSAFTTMLNSCRYKVA